MYSTPNGAQEQAEEGEASGGESEEWQSDGEGEEDDDGSSEEEEEEVVDPPRTERRSTAPVICPLPRLRRTFGVYLYGTLIFGLIIPLQNVKDQH